MININRNHRWGYLIEGNIAPVIVGEWGFNLNNPVNPTYEWTKIPWINAFQAYMNGYYSLSNVNSLKPGSLGMSSFFWAVNPSNDLQGFFQKDWVTINPTSIKYIQPLLTGSKLLR